MWKLSNYICLHQGYVNYFPRLKFYVWASYCQLLSVACTFVRRVRTDIQFVFSGMGILCGDRACPRLGRGICVPCEDSAASSRDRRVRQGSLQGGQHERRARPSRKVLAWTVSRLWAVWEKCCTQDRWNSGNRFLAARLCAATMPCASP